MDLGDVAWDDSLFHNSVVYRREYGYLGPSLQQMVSKLRTSPSAGGSGSAVAVVTCTPPLVPTAPSPAFVQAPQTKPVGEYRNYDSYEIKRTEFELLATEM